MNLTIDFTASEEAEISAAARQNGMAPADLIKELLKEHLPAVTSHVSTQDLFAKWAEEDAQLTGEEREQNERVYAEIEKNGIPRVQI
jgi:hypothetical protein